MKILDVILSPLEIKALSQRDLGNTLCVVFDVLRATSTMVAALSHGAACILPVMEISEALEIKQRQPEVLLAGERNGVLIGRELTGGSSFDLGNSPQEFISSKIKGKTLVMTTTNGTRALCACSGAARVFVGSFLNLSITVGTINRTNFASILLICAGTEEDVAYEDVLCAGAFIDLWTPYNPKILLGDSAQIAKAAYLHAQNDLVAALSRARNAKRLLSIAALRDDVAFCAQRDLLPRITEWKVKDGVQ